MRLAMSLDVAITFNTVGLLAERGQGLKSAATTL
jgi:hypothetical protein